MIKLTAITVIYHPNLEELWHNISSYATDVTHLILWDNSEDSVDLSYIKAKKPSIIIHQDGINHGLPTAYNYAIEFAKKHGCTHIMTMDQDSRFENFAGYIQWVEKSGNTGISATAINNQHPDNEESTIINDSAQSGSIFPLSLLKEIGPFREDLFISMVDAEMCLRAQEKGYKTIQYNKSNLIHHIGSGRTVYLLGHAISVSDYIALRHYYDSRNRILMWHEFPNDMGFSGKMKHLLGRLKVMVKIILFEKDKTRKVIAIIKGTWYGIINNPIPYKKT